MRVVRYTTVAFLIYTLMLNQTGSTSAEMPDCGQQAIQDRIAEVERALNHGAAAIEEEIYQENTINALGPCVHKAEVTKFLEALWHLDGEALHGFNLKRAEADNVRVSVASELLKAHNQHGLEVNRGEIRTFLRELMRSNSGRIKSNAVFAMAEFHDRESAEYLHSLVLTSPYRIAQAALKALYWNCAPSTDGILQDLTRSLTDERLIAVLTSYEREYGTYLREERCPALMGYPPKRFRK